MWHVKDMHKVSRDYTELGNGSIDYTKIWPDAAYSGMKHFFVEQGGNFAQDSMQSVTDCAAYVKRFLLPWRTRRPHRARPPYREQSAVAAAARPASMAQSISTDRLDRVARAVLHWTAPNAQRRPRAVARRAGVSVNAAGGTHASRYPSGVSTVASGAAVGSSVLAIPSSTGAQGCRSDPRASTATSGFSSRSPWRSSAERCSRPKAARSGRAVTGVRGARRRRATWPRTRGATAAARHRACPPLAVHACS